MHERSHAGGKSPSQVSESDGILAHPQGRLVLTILFETIVYATESNHLFSSTPWKRRQVDYCEAVVGQRWPIRSHYEPNRTKKQGGALLARAVPNWECPPLKDCILRYRQVLAIRTNPVLL
jgi:hypothetical protein